jgi:hypothetical protein
MLHPKKIVVARNERQGPSADGNTRPFAETRAVFLLPSSDGSHVKRGVVR